MPYNSYTTVGDVKRVLGSLFNDADVVPYISQALERITNSGLWKGVIGYAAFRSVNQTFALPYEFLSVVGASWFLSAIPVFGQMHSFIPAGPGQPLLNLPPRGIVEDLGDGYATEIDPPTEGSTIYLKTDLLIDNGKTFRLYGVGANGHQIVDVNGQGMNLNTNTSETTIFTQVTGIQPPLNADGSSAMIGGYTVQSVAPDSTVTDIAYVYPNQVYPQFHRYFIGNTSASNSQVPFAVTVLVRRRYMPIYKDTDWVMPGNIGALKFGMQAIDSEASKNEAEELWQKCYAILNQELHATRGAARPEMNYEVLGSFAGFNNVY